jgi:predicted NAD/FAD-dependent oxidoreductase
MQIAIIGAGLAGLSCARALVEGGASVRLFDKGRGAGGRMATRRVDTPLGQAAFDHGAQYLTARDPAFRAEVEAWAAAGLAAPWLAAGEDAWVGTPAMNAPLRASASGLPVRWGARVDGLRRDEAGWRLWGEGLEEGGFDAVLTALPAEQTAALVSDVAPAIAATAEATPSEPCWTAMAAFAGPLAVVPDVLKTEGPVSWAARNSAKLGRTGPEAWVVQASPQWSRERLEDEAVAVASDLLELFFEATGAPATPPLHLAAHRWRYARSGNATADRLWDERLQLGACGDWLIGPRAESAWLSGRRLARAVLGGD